MRNPFPLSSIWWSALVQGVFFAAWMGLWARLFDHNSWAASLTSAAIIGAPYTVAMYFDIRRQQRATDALLEGLDDEQRRVVRRAAATGTSPDDATLRAAAAALVEQQLADHDRHRTAAIVIFAAFTGLSVVVALISGGWYLLGPVLFGALLVWTVRYPGRLRGKLTALQPPPPVPAPPASSRP